jgi:ATP-binding cassette, subfamily F, member 3
MSMLTASNVGQSFGAYDVFSGVSASVPNDGKIGLVGPNGIGKTTLLLILAGLAQPTTGHVHVARGARLGYLSQESSDAFVGRDHSVYTEMLTVFDDLRADAARLRKMEQTMADGQLTDDLLERYSTLQQQFELAGGYEYEVRIQQALTGLGFTPQNWEQLLNHLSGGQKTRALLARLLLEKPDLLILDEPTNHLDVAAIEWLEGMLKTWDGALLVVSHDRYFLDSVVNTIWEMSSTGIESYRGNYSAYVAQRQARWEQKLQAFETFMANAEKELDYIRRNIAGQRTQMAQGKLSRLAREVEAVRVGGLNVLGELNSKGWLQVSDALDLRRPASTVGELHEALHALRPPVQPITLNVRLRAAQRSGNIVLRTSGLTVGYPGAPLFAAEDIELWRQEIAALIGPNGAGKTTFLRTILEQHPPLAGSVHQGASLKIGYFAQSHEELNPDNSVLDELLRHKQMLLSEARAYLARFLFRGDDVFNKVGTLSGGERARLALAILVLQDANLLLLDEPTNHLDIPAQETLQAALEAFSGTILLVSHDRYLVDRLATQIWELRNGRLQVYAGSYQVYLAQRSAAAEAQRAARVLEAQSTAAAGDDAAADNGAGLSKNELRKRAARLQQLEDNIHAAEAALTQFTDALQLATQSQDVDAIQRISQAYAAKERELESLLADWEVAHE